MKMKTNKQAKQMEKQTIFKVGDKVFDAQFGWGEVTKVNIDPTVIYPILVIFENEYCEYYNINGLKSKIHSLPCLSFTEYDFANGGFSQERPQEVPKRGAICWVKTKEESDFASRTNDKYNGIHWKYLTTQNPYENAESN